MALHKGKKALLVLEDGSIFEGTSCGADGIAIGEMCFNTSMSGYQEIISDPSYCGQIVALTYPQIGNYGVNAEDMQAREMFFSGLVVRDMCSEPSNFRSTQSLPDFLKKSKVVAIEGVDTRKLVRHIRENGAMQAIISNLDNSPEELLEQLHAAPTLVGQNLVKKVSVDKPFILPPFNCEKKKRVVAFDCGIKVGILSSLASRGCEIVVVPWNTSADEVLDYNPDGIFFSNGPGDPQAVQETYKCAQELLGKLPVFGICLGHQMLSCAAGAKIEKLPYGHHGGNQPVMNLRTGSVEITAQNHGFGQVFSSLGALIPSLSDGVDEHPSASSSSVVGAGERPGASVGKHPSASGSASNDLRFWAKRRVAPVVDNDKFGRIQLSHVNLNDGTPEGMAFLDIPAFSVQYHPEASPGPHDSSYLFDAFMRLMDGREDYLDIEVREARGGGSTQTPSSDDEKGVQG